MIFCSTIKMTNITTENRHNSFLSKSDFIADSIIQSIRKGAIKASEALPSDQCASQQYGVARKTVVRSYEKLEKKGIVESRPRKGYFVISKQPNSNIKVLLIVHSFDAHFEYLYNSFRNEVSNNCDIEIYFHHYNIKLLNLILTRNIDAYDLFIISSFDHPKIPGIFPKSQ